MSALKNDQGISVVAVVIMMLILATMGTVLVSLVATESSTSIRQMRASQAQYVAEGGMEYALYQFKTGTTCASLSYNNISLGAGTFTTTGTLYNPSSTTLSAGINNAVTTIPVASTAGYAPHGRIRIDSESINYTGTTATSFTGATRGAAGTTAAAHSSGASVPQNECLIQSTGAVSGSSGNSQRIAEVATQDATISMKQGSFTKSTTTPGPVSQSVTGIGFQPKAVIFFWTRQTAIGFGPLNSAINAGVGFATAATERAVSYTANDNQSNSDEGRRYSETNAIIFLTGGGPPTLAAQAALTTMDSDGFTLNWSTNNNSAYLIHYIALGGDITNAFAGTLSLTTSTGNQSVAGVGFQPDFVMFLWSYRESPVTYDTNIAGGEIGLGFAKSSTARGALVMASRDNGGNNTNKRWQQRTDSAILMLTIPNGNPAQDAIADFVSMDSNGFTINKSNAPANTASVFFLALKGGNHQVGAFNQPAATGNQSITGVGFRPGQLMLTSFNLIAQTGITGGGALSYGAARFPSARGGIWFQDRSDADPSDANIYTNNTNLFTLAQGNAASAANTGNPTINAQADFVSFDANGFTLNWTTTDATARQILYWAIGPTNSDVLDWREVVP